MPGYVTGTARFNSAIMGIVANVDKESKDVVANIGEAIVRRARENADTGSHAPGQGHIGGTGPGPNTVTGRLKESITAGDPRHSPGGWALVLGPDTPYARAVELGHPRWASGTRYPYLRPARDEILGSGHAFRIAYEGWARAVHGGSA